MPGDTWDYNSNMDIMLADLVLDEQPVKAILHAPKNGFFYVIDRTTGTLATAGNLVFQGRDDGMFVAYDASSGAIAWQHDLQLGISASPITYAIGDQQYIALLVGAGGGAASGIMGSKVPNYGWKYGTHTRRLVSFALDGEASIPPQPAFASVVRDGARQLRSMPKYSTLSDADLLALRHYIRQRAEHAGP